MRDFILRSLALLGLIALMSWRKVEYPAEQLLGYCQQFNQIQIDVREQNVSPDSAARAFQEVMKNIRTTLSTFDSCDQQSPTRFVYPLRGYQPKYSVGGRGRGYRSNGFNLFDMEARGSHPAHDLFIRDGNQDNLDDRMCYPVDLLSFSRGIVLATDTTWQPGSELRGGKYIWVYDPCLNGLFYYAHNSRVVVEPGQLVQAGQKLGEVGRTGYNAWKERSPTHVHMMFLKVNADFLPEPANPLSWLWEAEVRGW
jgi:peptidoglycan LD-endopeptidase LytH